MCASKWKVFFDIICPNSWVTFQILQNCKVNKSIESVEFIPISDVKLNLIRTYEERMKRRREHKNVAYQSTIRKTSKILSKSISGIENHILPADWYECYSSALKNGSLLPAVFLSIVKLHYPEHFIRSIEVIGRRMWNSRLPIYKGAHLFTCSREAGISFKDSDEIISRLSHVDNRQILHKNSEEALRLGISFAPFFVAENNDSTVVLHTIDDFERSVLYS